MKKISTKLPWETLIADWATPELAAQFKREQKTERRLTSLANNKARRNRYVQEDQEKYYAGTDPMMRAMSNAETVDSLIKGLLENHKSGSIRHLAIIYTGDDWVSSFWSKDAHFAPIGLFSLGVGKLSQHVRYRMAQNITGSPGK